MEIISTLLSFICNNLALNALVLVIAVGLWSKLCRKTGWIETYQLAITLFLIITILSLSIPYLYSIPVPQKVIEQLAIPSLVFSLVGMAADNLKDLGPNRRYIDCDSKVKTIQDDIRQANQDTQSILRQVMFMKTNLIKLQQEQFRQAELMNKALNGLEQQNRSQQNTSPVSEASESHNGERGISTN